MHERSHRRLAGHKSEQPPNSLWHRKKRDDRCGQPGYITSRDYIKKETRTYGLMGEHVILRRVDVINGRRRNGYHTDKNKGECGTGEGEMWETGVDICL